MRIDTHTHTTYSYHHFFGRDALNTPKEMIKAGIRKGLDGIAITDHDNIKGGLAGLKYVKSINKDFKVIPGVEITTAKGHLLALNVKENIKSKLSVEETVEKIHALGGVAVASHPYSEFIVRKCLKGDAIKADAIEVFNGNGTWKIYNIKAMNLANEYKKPKTAGSDSHFWKTVGNAGIICNAKTNDDIAEAIRKGKTEIFGKRNSYIDFSYLIISKFWRSIKTRVMMHV